MGKPIEKTKPPARSKTVPASASTKKSKPVKKTRPPTRPKPVPKPASTKKVRKAPVPITATQILAFGPPWVDDEGTFKDRDLDIPGGDEPPLPKSLGCNSSLVIYAVNAKWVDDCKGFSGPKAGDNSVVQLARECAHKAADKIPCDKGCVKRVVEIWHGWQCGPAPEVKDPPNILAAAAVELEIRCEIQS